MKKRDYKNVRNKLLLVLKDGKEHSYGSLERSVNTNWKTIRSHCENLEFFGVVNISEESKVKLNSNGLKLILKKL